jgi:hypothetical protein
VSTPRGQASLIIEYFAPYPSFFSNAMFGFLTQRQIKRGSHDSLCSLVMIHDALSGLSLLFFPTQSQYSF